MSRDYQTCSDELLQLKICPCVIGHNKEQAGEDCLTLCRPMFLCIKARDKCEMLWVGSLLAGVSILLEAALPFQKGPTGTMVMCAAMQCSFGPPLIL